MPIRIRVFPQHGRRNNHFGGYGGMRVNHHRQRVNMQLRYERAIFAERMRNMQVQAQLRYGGMGFGGAAFSPYGQLGLGGAAYGASYLPMGGYGNGFGNSFSGGFRNFFSSFC